MTGSSAPLSWSDQNHPRVRNISAVLHCTAMECVEGFPAGQVCQSQAPYHPSHTAVACCYDPAGACKAATSHVGSKAEVRCLGEGTALGSVCFPLVSLWCCGFLLAFGCCCLPRLFVFESLKGEYLSAGRKGTGTALATWCRGQSPTQGRSLCCHEEK